MANDNGDTRSVCYSDMEQFTRDTSTKTNRWVFHPGRNNRLVPTIVVTVAISRIRRAIRDKI